MYTWHMQEIFDVVLDREKEASRIIEEGEIRAREIGGEAEKAYNGTVKAAREKSRQRVISGTEEIRAEQDARVLAALSDYEKKWEQMGETGRNRLGALADKLARIVIRL